MKKTTLDWKDTPSPVPPGEPLATSEYSLPDPEMTGVKHLVKISISDFSGMEHPKHHPYRLLCRYAHREGGRITFYQTIDTAKDEARKLMRDLTKEWSAIARARSR